MSQMKISSREKEQSKTISISIMESFYTGIKDNSTKLKSYKNLVKNIPLYSENETGSSLE